MSDRRPQSNENPSAPPPLTPTGPDGEPGSTQTDAHTHIGSITDRITVTDGQLSSLSRLLICDLDSGQCLYERAWRTQSNSISNAPAAVRLIRVFFQFAREMREGEMTHVSFGPPEALSTRSELADRMGIVSGRSGSFSLAGSGASRHNHGRRRSRQKAVSSVGRRDPELCLTCDKEKEREGGGKGSIVAALFHDYDLEVDVSRGLCTAMIKSFRVQFASEIDLICEKLGALSPDDPTMPPDLAETVASTFRPFDADCVIGRCGAPERAGAAPTTVSGGSAATSGSGIELQSVNLDLMADENGSSGVVTLAVPAVSSVTGSKPKSKAMPKSPSAGQ